MRFFKKTFLLNLFTLAIAFLVLLDTVFYSGFTEKHFFINLQQFVLFYLIFIALLSILKLYFFPKKILSLNRIVLPTTVLISLILIFLEKINYPNFVFSHFHIHPQILFYLPLISLSISIFHDWKWSKQETLLIITPLVSTYLSQYIFSGKFFDFKLLNFNSLIYNLPNFRTIVINYILWLSLLLISIFIFKKRYQSFIFYLIFLVLFSLINHYKNNLWGAPLVISDTNLVGDLIKFIPSLINGTNIKDGLVIGTISLFIIFYFLKKFLNQNNPPIKKKLLLIIIPILIFLFPVFFPKQFQQSTTKLKIETYIPNPIDNCYVNGVLFCFYNDFKNINPPTPKNYNQETIQQVYSDLNSLPSLREDLELVERSGFKSPNIIIILSEAFWDPTLLPQVSYSQDPITNVRNDIKSTFISPSFGGGTANVGFELLTGLSNYFLNGISPYSQAIKKPLPSLFSLFKDQGYLTTAIHPFYASAYNRKSVYKKLNLDNFITIEDMKDPQYTGPFVSDTYFNQQLINQLNSTDKPQLIFGLSMQNHVVFKPNRYPNHSIKIKSNLNQNDQDILQSYVDGLYLTNTDYLQLKNTLSQIKKPTIIIFFGDHLTSLGNGTDIYQKAGFDTSNQTKMHSTFVTAWSNFNQKFDFPSQISPNFLSLEILKLANIQPKYQFKILNNLTQTDSVLSNSITPKFSTSQISDYELIQYDLLSGKQYSLSL